MKKWGCLSILARRAPRRAVASWKPCIVFLSCARAHFLWWCRVKQRWPSASCKSHGDGPATSPGASLPATEQPPSPPTTPFSFQVTPHLGPPASHFLPLVPFSVLHSLSLTSRTLSLLPSTSLFPSFLICLPSASCPLLLHVPLCPHVLSSLHPFFPPPFVPLSRSEEAPSDVSCASRRSRPHLVRGFLQRPSATPYRNTETCTLMSAKRHGATVHTENIWLFLAVTG